MQSTLVRESEMKKIFQTKKDFKITCSKLITNELGRFKTGLDNIETTNIKQISLVAFAIAFCFAHAEHALIKFKLI